MDKKKHRVRTFTRDLAFTPFYSGFIPRKPVIAAAGQSLSGMGQISLFSVDVDQSTTGKISLTPTEEIALDEPVRCFCTPDSLLDNAGVLHNVIAATVRGTIVSYDLSAPSLPVRQQKEAHASGINWICSRSDYRMTEYCTVGNDGHARVWDTRTSSAVIDISPSSNVDDLWAATFIGDDSLAFAGQKGSVKAIDLRSQKALLWTIPSSDGVCSLTSASASCNAILVSTDTGGLARVYDLASPKQSGLPVVAKEIHPNATAWGGCRIPSLNEQSATLATIATVGGDGYFRIEELSHDSNGEVLASTMVYHRVSSQPLLSVSCCQDIPKMAVVTDLGRSVHVVCSV